MNFSDLKDIDNSIEFISGNPEAFDVVGISHSDAPENGKFIFLKNKRFLNALGSKSESNIFLQSGVFIETEFFSKLDEAQVKELSAQFAWLATLKSVNEAMCTLSKPFHDILFGDLNYQVDGRQMNEVEIDPSAEIAQNVFIGEGVKIGKNVKILPGCVILPNVEISEDTIIFPNVTLYPYTRIGKRCRIHASTSIGTDGFGYNFFDGKHQKIWHLAGVIICDEVEVGCNTMIDAGAFTPTYIGDGSKIDNAVQISHNVKIHKHVIVCGTTGIAGSVEIHDYCAFGAGAGVAPAAKIGKGAQVAARAVVSENAVVPPGEVMAGHPARPLKDWMRSQATLRRLSKKQN